jgi:hypothetical protein
MLKLVKNITGFIRASLFLRLKSLVGASEPTCGVSTFIPPLFPVTMTHTLVNRSRANHSLEPCLLVIIIHLLWCFSTANEHPQPRQSHPDVIDLAPLQMSIHSLDGVIFIPPPTFHSFDIIDFISTKRPLRVGEEEVCYLKNEMVKVNFFYLYLEVHEVLSNFPYFPSGFTRPLRRHFISLPRFFICIG